MSIRSAAYAVSKRRIAHQGAFKRRTSDINGIELSFLLRCARQKLNPLIIITSLRFVLIIKG